MLPRTQRRYGYRRHCYMTVHRRRICENGHDMLRLQLQTNGRPVTIVAEDTSNYKHPARAMPTVQHHIPFFYSNNCAQHAFVRLFVYFESFRRIVIILSSDGQRGDWSTYRKFKPN